MNLLTQVALPLILAFMMFSMGLDLVVDDFKRIGKYPKAFFAGILLQFLSLPVLAFLIAKFSVDMGADPAFAIGLVIIAACPGGVTSNMMTHIAKGDTALSISLTAVTSIASVFTLPFIARFGVEFFSGAQTQMAFPIGKIIGGVFIITTVPLLLGMLIKAKAPNWSQKSEPLFRKIASGLFVLVIVAALSKDFKTAMQGFGDLGAMVLLLNIGTMAIALLVSKMMALTRAQGTAIVYECGFQNGTLAIFIALSLLKNEKMMLPGAIYGLTMFITGALYYSWLRKSNLAKAV